MPSPVSQAEAMIRRVSPEGRARAHEERQRRRRAMLRLVARIVLAGIAILIAAGLIDRFVVPLGSSGIAATLVAFAVACVAILYASREPPPSVATLAMTDLQLLPARTGEWLEAQRPALPAPAARLLDDIGARLRAMTPQLAALDPQEPAAAAVRKLLTSELPDLLAGYQAIPAPLRDRVREGTQRSADAHLLHGLGVVDGEIARMTEQLARGAFDELAVQHRYLELKYTAGDSL